MNITPIYNDGKQYPEWYIEAIAAQENSAIGEDPELISKPDLEPENLFNTSLFQLHFEMIGKAFGYVVSLLTRMKVYFSSFFQDRNIVDQTKDERDDKATGVFERALIQEDKLPVQEKKKETIDPTTVSAGIAAVDMLGIMAEGCGMGGAALETAQLATIYILSMPIVQEKLSKNETIREISTTVKSRFLKWREPAIVLTHNAAIQALQMLAFVGKHIPAVQEFQARIDNQIVEAENGLPQFARPFFEAAKEMEHEKLTEASATQLSAFVVKYVATPLVDSAANTVAKGFNDYMINQAVLAAKFAPTPLRAIAMLFANGMPKNNKEHMINVLRVTVLFTTGSPIVALLAVYGAETVIYAVKVNQKRIEIAERRAKEQEQAQEDLKQKAAKVMPQETPFDLNAYLQTHRSEDETNLFIWTSEEPVAVPSTVRIEEVVEAPQATLEPKAPPGQKIFEEFFW